jgi:hypothetical protein
LLQANEWAPRILPADAHCARRAVLQYRLKDSGRLSRLTIDEGNKVTFERDGDSLVVEVWLRRRGFVRTFVPIEGVEHEPVDVARVFTVAANA